MCCWYTCNGGTIRNSNGYAIWFSLVSSYTTRYLPSLKTMSVPTNEWETTSTIIQACDRQADGHHLGRSPYFTCSSRCVSAANHSDSTYKVHTQMHQWILPVEFHDDWQIIYFCLHCISQDLGVDSSTRGKQHLFLSVHFLSRCVHTRFWRWSKYTQGYTKAILQHSETLCDTLHLLFFFFWFWIHADSAPSTAGTSTGGGAVIRKPGSVWLQDTPAPLCTWALWSDIIWQFQNPNLNRWRQNSNTWHKNSNIWHTEIQNKWIFVPPKPSLFVWENLSAPSICHLPSTPLVLVKY